MGDEQVNEPGMRLIHNEIAVAVGAPGIGILLNGNGLCPRFVLAGEPSVPILFTDSSRKHIGHAVSAELIRYLFQDGRGIENVIAIIVADGSFNTLLACDICLEGSTVSIKLTVLTGIGCGLHIQLRVIHNHRTSKS